MTSNPSSIKIYYGEQMKHYKTGYLYSINELVISFLKYIATTHGLVNLSTVVHLEIPKKN